MARVNEKRKNQFEASSPFHFAANALRNCDLDSRDPIRDPIKQESSTIWENYAKYREIE